MAADSTGGGLQAAVNVVTEDDTTATLVLAGSGRGLEISKTEPVALRELLGSLLAYFGLEQPAPPALGEHGPWATVFDQKVLPTLVLASTAADGGTALAIEAGFVLEPPFHFGGHVDVGGGLSIDLLPYVRVDGIYIEYDRANGLGLKAKVMFSDTPSGPANGDGGAAQLVSYPFAAPVTKPSGDDSFRVEYFGLGQRFGPSVDINAADPLRAALDALEKDLTSTDPKTVLTKLVQNYYHPDRDWYVAAHVSMRGLDIRFVFSDPVLYGIEIVGTTGQFKGLQLEILYQKLGSDLGVYYGTLTLPEAYRTLNLGAVAITFPSISAWIYTNGDFKISVGWPLGDKSIVIQVAEFIGGGGFYFAKLRSADNPGTGGNVVYQPVLEFGLAVFWGVGRSISQGPLSAELSLTIQGTFQGVLAWRASGPDATSPGSLSNPPDNYWFAASVGIVGILQGSVDLAIIKASISIQISATVSVAFQLGYATIVEVNADVEVEASIKVVFFTIHISFSAHFSTSFTLGSGTGVASMAGPQGDLAGFQPPSLEPERELVAISAPAPIDRLVVLPESAADTTELDLTFVLHPTVVYDESGSGKDTAVAELLIGAPKPGQAAGTTAFERLMSAYELWLRTTYGPLWSDVERNLGTGWHPGPDDFEAALNAFLKTFKIVITGSDLTTQGSDASVAAFPMLPPLVMTPAGLDPVAFAVYPQAPTARAAPSDYAKTIDDYFQQLALGNGAQRDARAATAVPHSVAEHVYADYFLLLARQIVHEHVDPRGLANPASQLAGIGSRFLIHGVRLPTPDAPTPPGPGTPTAGLAELTGQQVPITGSPPTFAATLALNPNEASAATKWDIAFGDGTAATTTATMPVAAAPAAPDPDWAATAGAAGTAPTRVSPLSPLWQAPLWFGARTQIGWMRDGTATAIIPLPQPLMQLAAGSPTSIAASSAPPAPDGKASSLPSAPALLIRVPLERVARWSGADVAPSGAPNSYLPDVYQLRATDEETRLLIERILAAGGALDAATIALACTENGKMRSTSADQPFLAKANLSTTNRPGLLADRALLMGRAALAESDLGPVCAGVATAADRAAFLRLVWECTVTNGTEFYLHCAGLEDAFGGGGTTEAALVVELSAPAEQCVLAPYANALIATTTAGLFVNAVGRTRSLPLYPPGCVGFEVVRTRPEPDEQPYSPATIDALYSLVQFRVLASSAPAAGAPAFGTSSWSQPIGPEKDGADDRYRCVVPVYRFVTPADASASSPYAAMGGAPSLELLLEDVFGNQLDCKSYREPFPVLYGDPLVPPDEWPGIHLGWSVSGSGAQVQLELTASFVSEDVLGKDQVVIAAPAPGSPVNSATVAVAGTVCNTADTLTCQVGTGAVIGVPVDPQTGAWSVNAGPLAPGENTITVVATSKKGSTSSTVVVDHRPGAGLADAPAPKTTVDTFATRAATALTRYATIVEQLADPGMSLTLSTTLAPPPVAITEPTADAAVPGPTVTVRGVVQDLAAKVTVDGLAAVVGPDGTFVVDGVAVPASGATVTATAALPDGSTATATVRLWLDPDGTGSTTSAPPGLSGVVAGTAQLRDKLKTLVDTVVTQLETIAAGQDADEPVLGCTLGFPLPADPLCKRLDDVFAVDVYLSLARAANIDPAAAGQLPSAASVACVASAAPLAAFAPVFEGAFAGFDGADGVLKLASRPAPASGSVASSQLWAMRWSASAGVHVAVAAPADETVYFAPKPLAKALAAGTFKMVPSFNGSLQPTYAQKTVTGVDLDAWGREFLSDLEGLLAPEMAPAVGALAADDYKRLMASKADLAEAISSWIAPVYVDQVGKGDLATAKQEFEQALLTDLAADYGTGAIVQRPVTVTVAGVTETAGVLPPRLYGTVAPPPLWVQSPADHSQVGSTPAVVTGGAEQGIATVTANKTVATTPVNGSYRLEVPLQQGPNVIELVGTTANKDEVATATVHVELASGLGDDPAPAPPRPAPYTFSSTQLPLAASSEQQYLTFLASTTQSLATLDMPLDYVAPNLDHELRPGEGAFGYTPSSWLVFALAGRGSQLDFPLGPVSIPLPLRAFPPSPVLVEQTAVGAPASAEGGVAIGAPQNGAILNAAEVMVSGRAPSGNVVVTVGNVQATLEERDGTWWFSAPTPLARGENTIVVTATEHGQDVGSATATVTSVQDMGIEDALAHALTWNYRVTANVSEDPHDELVVQVLWNQPIASGGSVAAARDDDPSLLETLTCFRSAYPGLEPYVESAPAMAWTGGDHQQCVQAIGMTAQLVADVAGAWKRHIEPALDGQEASTGSTSEYRLRFADVSVKDKLVVLGRDSAGDLLWPTINGVCGDGGPDSAAWSTRTYEFPTGQVGEPLVLEWLALPVLRVQNATAQLQTVRNADLGGKTVNDDFVLKTPVVAFQAPVVPSVSVDGLGPLPAGATLTDTLAQVFAPLLSIDTAIERGLCTAVGYAAPVASPGTGADPLLRRSPILLVPSLTLGPVPPGAADDPVADFVGELARSLETWLQSRTSATTTGRLVLDIILSGAIAGTEIPLLNLTDVEVCLPG